MADDQKVQEPVEADALVLDANAFGKAGALSIDRLEELVEVIGDEPLEVWLPEPVLWEAAVHVAEAAEEIVLAAKRARKVLSPAMLSVPEVPSYGDREDLVDELIAAVEDLAPNIVVISASGEAAVEGLKDQILQRPPGRKKSGVRTGASDSTWIRSVEDHATATSKSYVIVSSDRDVTGALKHLGYERRVFGDLIAAQRALFQYSQAPQAAIAHLISYLRQLPDAVDWAPMVQVAELENEDWLLTSLFGPDKAEIVRETDIEVMGLGPLVGLTDVEIDRSGGRLLAQVSFRAHAQISIWYDAEVEGDIQLVSDVQDVYDGVLTLPIALETDDNQIVRGRTEGEAFLSPPDRGFSDAEEALNQVVYALESVPGLGGHEIFDAVFGGGRWEGQLYDGTPISIHQYHDDGYKDMEEAEVLEVAMGSDVAAVRWHYDPNSWVGGSEGFAMDDEYLLEVDFESELAEHPTWALPAWILANVSTPLEGAQGVGVVSHK